MVILDINLKGDRDGISVAKFLDGKQIPFIFLTSYYDEATLDRVKETHFAAFIAKPYTELDLRLNIELARRRNQPVMEGHNTKFYTYTDNKMTKKIYYQDVLFIKSEDNYSIFHTKEKKEIIVRIPLKNLADELGDKRFFKIHRSYIINVDKIQSFSNNTVVIEGLQVPISSSHRKEFKEFINDLWS
jgi:DNA-binding LytR/AlgR family response regulator